MRRTFASLALFLALLPAASASGLPTAVTTSAVFIANVSRKGDFLGWGSGFFVDEGIVVTNKHVIEDGDWYRVYATGSNEKVDTSCYRDITKGDVRVNLDDDVAYMRVYLPCAHGTLTFADDPWEGDPVSVIGFPYKGSLDASMHLTVSTGAVLGETHDGWLATDAALDFGNSGGPVIVDGQAAGVAVAKAVDLEGNYLSGYFIPSSTILRGLLYANDSNFGYTQSSRSSSSRTSSSSSVSSSSVSSPSGMSSRSSSSSSARSSSSRASVSSKPRPQAVFRDVPIGNRAFDAIQALAARGIIGGYPDGTFRPLRSINRAEFVKILVDGFRPGEVRGETGCFRDVGGEWYAPYACAAKKLGWIEGYADPSPGSKQARAFRPDQTINRAEALKILMTAFGANAGGGDSLPSDVSASSWFAPFVARGIALGIVNPRTAFSPGEFLVRGDAALWIDGATD